MKTSVHITSISLFMILACNNTSASNFSAPTTQLNYLNLNCVPGHDMGICPPGRNCVSNIKDAGAVTSECHNQCGEIYHQCLPCTSWRGSNSKQAHPDLAKCQCYNWGGWNGINGHPTPLTDTCVTMVRKSFPQHSAAICAHYLKDHGRFHRDCNQTKEDKKQVCIHYLGPLNGTFNNLCPFKKATLSDDRSKHSPTTCTQGCKDLLFDPGPAGKKCRTACGY